MAKGKFHSDEPDMALNSASPTEKMIQDVLKGGIDYRYRVAGDEDIVTTRAGNCADGYDFPFEFAKSPNELINEDEHATSRSGVHEGDHMGTRTKTKPTRAKTEGGRK